MRDHCGSLSYRWFCSAQTPVKDGRSTALQHLPKAQSGSPLHDQRFAEIDFTFDGAELPASQPGHLSEGAPQALPPQQRCLSRPCAPALCRAAAAPPRRAGRPGARGEAGPAARREKCFKLPIRATHEHKEGLIIHAGFLRKQRESMRSSHTCRLVRPEGDRPVPSSCTLL